VKRVQSQLECLRPVSSEIKENNWTIPQTQSTTVNNWTDHQNYYHNVGGECLWYCLLTYLLTYLLTHSLTHSLHGAGYYLKGWLSLNLSKNILLSYGTGRFITVFTQAHHRTISWASWIQFAPLIPQEMCAYITIPTPRWSSYWSSWKFVHKWLFITLVCEP
jgi:hypothetical protein